MNQNQLTPVQTGRINPGSVIPTFCLKPSKTLNHVAQPNIRSSRFLLSPHFQHFSMTIRMHVHGKSRATSRSIFRKKPTGLIPNPTCITKSFRTKRTGSPLRSLLGLTVATPPLKQTSPTLNSRFLLWFLRNRFVKTTKPLNILNRVRKNKTRS